MIVRRIPSPEEMMADYAASVADWAGHRFAIAPPDTAFARLRTCRGCQLWYGAVNNGNGECIHYARPCAKVLPFLQEQFCPLDEWEE